MPPRRPVTPRIAAVAATADALHRSMAQMQFLEDARNTIRHLKLKPDDAQ
jgi:hypothetical protein